MNTICYTQCASILVAILFSLTLITILTTIPKQKKIKDIFLILKKALFLTITTLLEDKQLLSYIVQYLEQRFCLVCFNSKS